MAKKRWVRVEAPGSVSCRSVSGSFASPWRYGYLFALSLMALIALGLYVMFRRRHWL